MENKTGGNMITKKEITQELRYRNTALSKWVDVSKKLDRLGNAIRIGGGYCKLFSECIICTMSKEGICGVVTSGLARELGNIVNRASIISNMIRHIIETDIEAYKKSTERK